MQSFCAWVTVIENFERGLRIMRLYVSNLPWATSEEELSKLFGQYGKVEACEIVRDRETSRSKGFGFVTMTEEDAGQKAMTALHDKDFAPSSDHRARPRKIRVEVAKPRPGR